MKNPIVIQSLEEDFRKIGLLTESDEQDALDERAITKAGKARARGPHRTGRRRIKTGKGKFVFKKVTAAQRKKEARGRKKGSAKAMRKRYMAKRGKKLSMKRARMGEGMDRVSNLIKEVEGILSTMRNEGSDDLLKGFANVAAISDLLVRQFEAMNEEYELEDAIESLKSVAENAAEVAESLNEGQDDFDGLEEYFNTVVAITLEGLELYNDLTEDDEELDEKKGGKQEADDDEEMDDEEGDEEGNE